MIAVPRLLWPVIKRAMQWFMHISFPMIGGMDMLDGRRFHAVVVLFLYALPAPPTSGSVESVAASHPWSQLLIQLETSHADLLDCFFFPFCGKLTFCKVGGNLWKEFISQIMCMRPQCKPIWIKPRLHSLTELVISAWLGDSGCLAWPHVKR